MILKKKILIYCADFNQASIKRYALQIAGYIAIAVSDKAELHRRLAGDDATHAGAPPEGLLIYVTELAEAEELLAPLRDPRPIWMGNPVISVANKVDKTQVECNSSKEGLDGGVFVRVCDCGKPAHILEMLKLATERKRGPRKGIRFQPTVNDGQ